jgi:hypothetical protein
MTSNRVVIVVGDDDDDASALHGVLPKLLEPSFNDEAECSTTISMSPSSSLESRGSMISNSFLERTWLPVKTDLLHIVGLEDERATIPLFRSLHEAGVSSDILKSLALLSSISIPDDVRDQCLDRFALYLASKDHSYHTKLGCIRTLMVLTSPIDASWQLEEGCMKETLEFVLERQQDWVFPEHSEALVLWELRAKCLRFSELSEQEYRLEVEDVVKGGEVAAQYIAGAAKWVQRGLKWSVPVINGGLETAGDKLKKIISPQKGDHDMKSAILVASCTSSVKKATDGVRITTRRTMTGIRDASSHGIQMAAKRFDDEKFSHKLVPDQDHRDVLAAAGKVGIASLGASIVVGEAIYDTTKAIAQKTASVTADVVRHKYGDAAGQIIQDTSDTTGNILDAIARITLLEARVFSNTIMKDSGRQQFDRNHQEEDGEGENPLSKMLMDSTKVNAQAVVDRLQKRRPPLMDKASPTTTRV